MRRNDQASYFFFARRSKHSVLHSSHEVAGKVTRRGERAFSFTPYASGDLVIYSMIHTLAALKIVALELPHPTRSLNGFWSITAIDVSPKKMTKNIICDTSPPQRLQAFDVLT